MLVCNIYTHQYMHAARHAYMQNNTRTSTSICSAVSAYVVEIGKYKSPNPKPETLNLHELAGFRRAKRR